MKNKLLMTVTIAGLLLMSVQNFAQAPTLGTAADFVLFSTVGAVGNTGISHVTGNVGTNSGAITGFGNVNGVMNTSNGATAAAAADLLIAYNQLNSAIPNYFPAPLLGNGQILEEGVYAIAGPTTLNNELTLDAQNDPDAVFIFQINGAFSTAALSSVTLINGAQACNVFWKIEGLVDMATGTTMRGTVIANNGAINMNADGVLEGRALSTSGAVNVSGVLVYTPIGCGSPVLMGPAAPELSSAACYAIFSGNGPVSNAGITNVIGDVGTNVGLTTGFDPLLVNGMIHPIPDGSTAAAAADLLNAYNYLNTLPFDIELLYPAQFGNDLVLTPHTYLLNAATTFTGDLYLNAGGQADAVFVIQINGALTTSTYANVILMDGTKPENVFWKVDGAVAINDYSNFVGTIVANNGAVDLTTGVILEGRAFTTTGALSTASVTVNMPPGCGDFTAPEIITQPEDQTVCIGESVSFTVVASGLDLTYQWRKGLEELTDGGNLSGTTSNVFTINPASIADDASDYNVVVSGTYSPEAISEDVSLTVQPLPENVSAGFDANTCATCPYTFFEATAENYSSLLWTTSGDGEFDDDTALNPVYTPGLTDPGTTVILCLSAYPIAPCIGLPVEDCMELEVLDILIPTADAGDDQTICEDQVAELVGEAENYSGLMWSTSGDGEFSSPISLITNYTPGAEDILAGVVELCLTAELILPGSEPAVDCMTLTIIGLPTAYAGADATVCATCPYSLLDATAENYSSLLWTTTGDGEFDDATALHPVYVPGLTDPGTTVVLCLVANTLCNAPAYEDCMELVVEPGQSGPIANAGADQAICEDQDAELIGEAYNYTSVLWTTTGDGEFSAQNSLITNYTPGPLDLLAETVELCLTATLDGALPVSDVDCLILTIYVLPTVNAGNDIIACSTQEIETNPTVNNYQQIQWITSGDGYFVNNAAEITNYIPGANDLLQGEVDLCLVAYGVSPPCISVVMDCLKLFLETTPIVDAGLDLLICEGDNAQLNGTAENYAEILWTTDGDGVFDNATLVNAIYTPGAADVTNGSVELCLTAQPIAPCEEETISCMELSIQPNPTAYAGNDATVCAECPFTFTGVTAENYSSFFWTSTGDGVFENEMTLNPTYTPGLTDPGTTVVLCLSLNPIAPCDGLPVQDCMELEVLAALAPLANAGDDQAICEDQVAELAGEAENYTSLLWTTSGDGVFSAPNSLITDYTPGTADISAGTAELCLTATLVGNVTVSDVDCMTLTIYILPTVDAGADIIACSNQTITTNPIVTNYSQLSWITSGDGYFENDEIEITNYIPGANDLLQGQVELCLVAYGTSPPCISFVMDCLQLFIEYPPTVDAGNNFTVCEGEDAQLNGTAENYSNLLWTTQGDGTFDNATILNPVYTPGVSDNNAGSVGLCLTATGSAPCDGESSTDCLVLNIIGITSISGLDTEMTLDCSDYDVANHVFLPVELYPVIENAGSVFWTTTGDGYFEDETMENPVYHLGSNDIWNGGFTLCIEASPTICSPFVVVCINIIVPIQIISIETPSWNGISSYVEKSSFTVPQVMAPVVSQLNFMLNSVGKYYWPNAVPPVNQLGNWLPIGYKAKFNSPACLPLYGDVIANQSFQVSGAFTFLPVLTNVPTSIDNLLGANASLVLLIYDWSAGMVWTNPAADLQILTPGKAYLFVKKAASTSFNVSFPDFDPTYFAEKSATEPISAFAVANSPWNDIVNTAQPHIILFAEGSLNDLQPGDIIGAFNENGLCVGVSEFTAKENFNKLIALGDDSFTDGVDGYKQGEKMTFRLYRPNTATTSDIYFAYDPTFPSNDGMFEVNGVSSVTKLTMALTAINDLTGQSAIQVFPNPAKDVITIVSDITIKQITLVSLTGQLLLDLPVNGTEIQVDLSKFINGLYFLQIVTSDEFITTKRLIIK